MATMKVHPADEISVPFLHAYFNILTSMPHVARKFYLDASVVCRPGPDGTMMSFTSVEAINKHILSCGYEDTSFELLEMDSHNTLEYGINVMVIGFLTRKNSLKRKFSQMFYLARLDARAYVILNDIFRYVDNEEAFTPTHLPAVKSMSETEVAKLVDETNKTLQPIHKADADDENWIYINADDVKNDQANVTETAARPHRLDGTELRAAIAAMVQRKRKNMGQPKPMCKTESNNGKIEHSSEKVVGGAQEPTEPVAPQPDGANKSLVAKLKQFLFLAS